MKARTHKRARETKYTLIQKTKVDGQTNTETLSDKGHFEKLVHALLQNMGLTVNGPL